MPDVDLVGIVDPLPAAREQVAADCRTTAYADHRDLLGQVDGAVIATPTRFHHAVALDFLRHGTPLLIEKPLAADLAEADELVEAAARHGTLVQVGHIERFNPAFVAAAAASARHGTSKPCEPARSPFARPTSASSRPDDSRHRPGVVAGRFAAHAASQALGMAVLGRHEDVAQARLEFANGCVANLSASRVSFSPAPKRQMQIWSEQGFAALDFGNRTASLVSPCDAVLERKFDYESLAAEERAGFKDRLFSEILRVEPLAVESRNAWSDELHDFVGSIREHRQPRVTGRQGRDAVAVAEAILQSIRDACLARTHGRAGGPVGHADGADSARPALAGGRATVAPRREAG